jgi:hypothetical protein
MLCQVLGQSHLQRHFLHLLLVKHDSEGVMGSIDIVIYTGVPLAAAIQVEVSNLSCIQVDVFDIHAEILEFFKLADLISGCEELYQPSVDKFARHIFSGVRVFPLKVEVVPELEMSVSLEGFRELLKDWL